MNTEQDLRDADQESRRMFVARLGQMQKDGHCRLTIAEVLALLNDCDMLASIGKETLVKVEIS